MCYVQFSSIQADVALFAEGLYTEGRLQPGTPPFLIHYYMLTLSASFMYLILDSKFSKLLRVIKVCFAFAYGICGSVMFSDVQLLL